MSSNFRVLVTVSRGGGRRAGRWEEAVALLRQLAAGEAGLLAMGDCGGGVVWCSRACQLAGEEQHDWECGLLDREGEEELSATALLLLRLWLRSTNQPEVGEQVSMGQG